MKVFQARKESLSWIEKHNKILLHGRKYKVKEVELKTEEKKSMLLIHRSLVQSKAAGNDKLISGRVHVSVTPESESSR